LIWRDDGERSWLFVLFVVWGGGEEKDEEPYYLNVSMGF